MMKEISTFDEAVELGLVDAPTSATKKPVTVRCAIVREAFPVDTLEGEMTAVVGSILIEGVKGEIYPCDAEIFDLTYE